MRARFWVAVLLSLSFAAFAQRAQELTRSLVGAPGSGVEGTVTLREEPDGVRVVVSARGLSPGLHGVHFHERGVCEGPAFESAGGHYNPLGAPRGLPMERLHHLGDLGNMAVDERGVGYLEILVVGATLEPGAQTSLVDRALIVHEEPDHATQPAGDAGGRVGCAEIRREAR